MEKKGQGARVPTGRQKLGGASQGRSLRKGLRPVSGAASTARRRRRREGGGGRPKAARDWLKGVSETLAVGSGQGVELVEGTGQSPEERGWLKR